MQAEASRYVQGLPRQRMGDEADARADDHEGRRILAGGEEVTAARCLTNCDSGNQSNNGHAGPNNRRRGKHIMHTEAMTDDIDSTPREWIADALAMFRDEADDDGSAVPEEPQHDAELIDEPLRPFTPKPGGCGKFTPRPYQNECVPAVFGELQTHRSTLVIMPTGLGKTVVAAELALRLPDHMGRVLFISHTKDLVKQSADSIGEHLGQECGIEMGGQSEARMGRRLTGTPKVLVASVQTLSRLNRAKAFDPMDFGLVILDECHRSTSDSWGTVIGYFQQNPQCRFVGLTATPFRYDKEDLGTRFESIAYERDLLWGINEGWLVPIETRFITIDEVNLSRVRTIGGDLNQKQLEDQYFGNDSSAVTDDDRTALDEKHERMCQAVAKPTIEIAAGRSFIVFCTSCAHADYMTKVFRGHGVTCESVNQHTEDDLRAKIHDDFRAGQLQGLCSVNVHGEGFDARRAAVIAIASATKSKGKAMQRYGRGTRTFGCELTGDMTADERKAAIAASEKPHMTLIDFVGDSGRHNIASIADILGEAYPEDLRAEVIEKMRSMSECADIREELAQAQARREEMERIRKEAAEEAKRLHEERIKELQRRAQEERERKNLRAEVKYTQEKVDIFGGRAEFQPEQLDSMPRCGASEAQVRFLCDLGIKMETAAGYSKRQAGAVITERLKLSGGKFRVTFGKNWRGKSLAECGSGMVWWVKNKMEPSDRRTELLRHIAIMEQERANG